MTTTSAPGSVVASRGTRRFGYAVAAAVNVGMLVLVNNVLNSDNFPWVTSELTEVLPVINVTLIVGIVANVVFILSDVHPIKPAGDVITAAVGMVAGISILRVFPFDFSAYDFNWEFVTRAILIVSIVGSAIGVVVSGAKALRPERSGP